MTEQGQTINAEQNTPRSLDLLAASDSAHAHAERLENVRWALALLVTAISLVASAISSVAGFAAIVGSIGAIGIWVLGHTSRRPTIMAARIQEMFDDVLFSLPDRPGRAPGPSDEEVLELARRYRGQPKLDWYVDVSTLPRAYAVLLCQRENLLWDWRLRRRWVTLVAVSAGLWLMLGLAAALVADWSVRSLALQWVAPSLPILLMAADVVRENARVVVRKQDLSLRLGNCLALAASTTPNGRLPDAVHAALMSSCASFQEEIFQLRCATHRVPRWLYSREKDNFELDSRSAASALKARLLQFPPGIMK